VLDLILPGITVFATFGIFRTITVVITLSILYPQLILIVLFGLFLMFLIVRRSLGPMRETQRKDSLFRGPIHSSFTNVVNGLVSLRAYERLPFFRETFIDQLEKSCNVTFTFYCINRWMSMVLDLICLMFTLTVSFITMYAKNKYDSDFLAFSLQIITDVVV
jgi:ABC-type bacteriocin/lantibiotic exporter with double-glycine peptidase domain